MFKMILNVVQPEVILTVVLNTLLIRCEHNALSNGSFPYQGLVPGTMYTVGIETNSKDKTSQRVVCGFMTGQ